MNRTEIAEKYVLPFLIWVIAFFAPIYEFIAIIGFMIFADTITGVLAANKMNEQIQSRKLFRSVEKFISYGLGIIIAQIVSCYFLQNFPAVQLMAGFIAFIEVKSIDENICKITGHSIFNVILEKLKHGNKTNS